MTHEEMMGMLATKDPCANPPSMEFDSENPTELTAGQQATLDVIGGVPPYTFEIFQTSLFYLDGSYIAWPPGYSDTYIKVTNHNGAQFEPWFAADPTLARHGDSFNISWQCDRYSVTEQRWNIDLGSAKTIKQIMLENFHHSAIATIIGIKNFALQGSNDPNALAQVDYSSDQYWTDIQTGLQAAQHAASNYDDPQLFDIDNDTAYRYLSLKIADNWGDADWIGFRHVQFHTAGDKVYKFITNDPQIIITAPSYALWTAHIKVTDLCNTVDHAFLYTSAGKWAIQDSWTVGGIPTTCGDVNFRIIKNGCMFEGELCNTNNLGLFGYYALNCIAYGGGEHDIIVSNACGAGIECDYVKNLNTYCWPFP